MNHKTLILLTTLISASALNGMEKEDLSLRERFCVWTTRHPFATMGLSTLAGLGVGYVCDKYDVHDQQGMAQCGWTGLKHNLTVGGLIGALISADMLLLANNEGTRLAKYIDEGNARKKEEAERAFLASNDHDCATGFVDWQRLKEAEYKHAVALKSYRDMSLRERLDAAYDLRQKHSGYQNDGHNGRHLKRIIAVFEQQLRTKEQLAAERKRLNS